MTGGAPSNTRPTPKASLRRVEIGDSTVLFDRDQGLSHLLNRSATLVWDRIDGTRTATDILDDLVIKVGADRGSLERDVAEVIGRFRTSGLIDVELAPAPSPPAGPSPAWIEARARLLDQWTWAEPGTVRQAGGARIHVRSDNIEIARRLTAVLSALPPVDPAPGEPTQAISVVDRSGRHDHGKDFRLYANGDAVGRSSSIDGAIEMALSRVNLFAIENTPERILMHAGAVERDGEVVVIAGVSGRGKSTLTAAMVQAGWAYLTDEMVAIDPQTWLVDPYPKALDLSSNSLELLGIEIDDPLSIGKQPVPPGLVGDVSVGGRLKAIVLLTGEIDENNVPRLTPVEPVDAVIEVLRNTFDRTMDLDDGLGAVAAMCDRQVLSLARTPVSEATLLIDEIPVSGDIR